MKKVVRGLEKEEEKKSSPAEAALPLAGELRVELSGMLYFKQKNEKKGRGGVQVRQNG